MTIRSFSLVLATLALLVFCAQPVFAHCGKCGMGDEKDPQKLEQMKEMHDCDCGKHGKHDCDCAKHCKHDCDCGKDGKHDCDCAKHGKHDCDCGKDGKHDCDCGMKGHHHGMHEHGDDGGKPDDQPEKDKN
jgi:hypothetical protein